MITEHFWPRSKISIAYKNCLCEIIEHYDFDNGTTLKNKLESGIETRSEFRVL